MRFKEWFNKWHIRLPPLYFFTLPSINCLNEAPKSFATGYLPGMESNGSDEINMLEYAKTLFSVFYMIYKLLKVYNKKITVFTPM